MDQLWNDTADKGWQKEREGSSGERDAAKDENDDRDGKWARVK